MRSRGTVSGRVALLVALVAPTLVVGGTGAAVAAPAAPPVAAPAAAPTTPDAAMAAARRSGSPVVVDSLTTESRLVRANPWGTFSAELTAGPARVRAGGGAWREVDPTLVAAADGSVQPRVTVTPMRLSGGGDRRLVSITDGAAVLGMDWVADLPTPVLDGTSATYPEVFPGVDLVVRVGAEDFSTYVVVKNREAARDPRVRSIRYLLRQSGVTSSAVPTGESLTAKDAQGRVRFEAGRALMWDSGERSGGPAPRAAGSAKGVGQGRLASARMGLTGGALTVTPDLSLLDSPDAVFPVVVDPNVKRYRENTYWTSVASNGYRWVNSSTEMARVGYNGWESPTFVARSFYRFDTSAFSGKVIKKATFSHKLVHSPNNDCSASTFGAGVRVFSTTTGISSSTVWPGPALAAYSPTINARAHGGSSLCSGYDRLDWDVRSLVDAAGSTLTLGMRSSDENDRNGWRKFDNDSTLNYPRIDIEYNSLPGTPARPTLDGAVGTYPASLFTSDSTPILRSVVTDPDGTEGGQVRGRFEIWSGGTRVVSGDGSLVNSGGTSTWTVPEETLTQGVKYTVRVYGKDYADQSAVWSDYIQFTGDWVPPAIPIVTQPDDVYAGSTVSVQISGPVDAKQFCMGLNTDAVGSSCVATTTPTVPITWTTPALTKAGPNWITVATKDAAGLLSAPVKVKFEVKPTAPNHRWALDGNGSDALGGLTVTPVAGTPFGDGNTASWGNPDSGLHTNGSSQFASATGPAVSTGAGASFSVAAWVRYEPPANPSIAQTVASQLGSQASAFYLGARNGRPAFAVKTADSTAGTNVIQNGDTTSNPFAEAFTDDSDGWVHLTGVYNGTTKKAYLYVNGVEWASAAVVGDVFDARGTFLVGRAQHLGAPADFWPGDIDDVATFPGVVDTATINMLKDGTEP